jgi:FKBP-type peptidyl-prolyl cis-trans isomerase FklB
MRRAGLLPLAFALLAAPSGGEETASPKNEAWKLGYSIGYQVGGDFRRAEGEIDSDLLVEGVLHALEGTAPRLTPDEMREALGALQEASGSPGTGSAEGER